MIKLETVDYLRLCSLPRRTITVDLPAELVARKGNNRIARARCQAVQANLRDAVRAKFKQAVRRPFRSEVAIHLALFGLSLPEATPTIKALLDSLDGPVYPDDRAVALLDVVASPGALSATISVCSAREYTDAFDVLAGASGDHRSRRDLDWGEDHEANPWAWDREALDGDIGIEITRENLADLESDPNSYPPDLRTRLIELDRQTLRERELRSLFSTPYLPTDRPGPPNIAGRLWNDATYLCGPACVVLPAPRRAKGSWTKLAQREFEAHLHRWRRLPFLLGGEPLALDIAIGRDAADVFDIDNLAMRVLKAARAAGPDHLTPASYRVYRRHGDDDAVVVRLHSSRRSKALRSLLGGSPAALFGVRPDPDTPARRRRSGDEEMYEEIQKISTGH